MGILKFILAGVLIYASLVGLLWFFQERIAFPAPRRSLPDPAVMGVLDAERVVVTTSDGIRLFGWYLKPTGDSPEVGQTPALIWFYGNFETVSTLAPALQILRPPGWAVLALDIRGYGESEGRAHEAGFYKDAEAAWDFLGDRPEIDSTRIAVYGRSLGSALALHLSASKPVAGVILEAPFTSGRELGKQFYWWVPSFLVKVELDNLENARKTNAPMLVLHGAEDDIVPLDMGRRVAEAGRADAFMVFENAGHNDMLLNDPERYRAEWMAFLETVNGGDRRPKPIAPES